MTVTWTCPEDDCVVSASDEESAQEAVRLHFEDFAHEHLSLAGFMDSGPVIAGWVP